MVDAKDEAGSWRRKTFVSVEWRKSRPHSHGHTASELTLEELISDTPHGIFTAVAAAYELPLLEC